MTGTPQSGYQQPAAPPGRSPDPRGDNEYVLVRERLAALEARLEGLATKEDMQKLRTTISDESRKTLMWGIGILGTTCLGLTAILLQILV